MDKSREGIFYGWWVLFACSLISSYGVGTFHYGFSVFVHPVLRELGWSMALISGAFSVYRLEAGVIAPLTGYLLDRIGPRKLVMSGALIMGSGFLYMSQVMVIFHFYVACFIISSGFSLASGTALGAPLIGKWFVAKRGRALGVYYSSIGLGGLLVPLLAHLIALYGWRMTLLIMAPLTWIVPLPLSIILRRTPEEYGLLPDGGSAGYSQDTLNPSTKKIALEDSFPFRKAISTAAFWILAFCFSVWQMTMSAIFVHLIPHLIAVGIEARVAAFVITFVTLMSLIGRMGFGWMSDLFSKKWILVIAFLVQPIGILALARVRELIDIIPFLLTYATSYGGLTVMRAAIVGEYYGRMNIGTIYGVMHGITILGGVVGPVIAGFFYDVRGNYDLAFLVFAIANILSALLLAFIRKPKLSENNSKDAAEA